MQQLHAILMNNNNGGPNRYHSVYIFKDVADLLCEYRNLHGASDGLSYHVKTFQVDHELETYLDRAGTRCVRLADSVGGMIIDDRRLAVVVHNLLSLANDLTSDFIEQYLKRQKVLHHGNLTK